MKQYHSAPLPFIGQKRKFLELFKRVLNEAIPGDGEGWTVLDAFGGSGLLAHTAKRAKPAARVIYNDFDGYTERLQHIGDTNRLRQQLSVILADYPREQLITGAVKQQVEQVISDFDGFVDLTSVASWLLFSGRQAANMGELIGKTIYNCLRRTDYPNASGYLDGLDIVRESYHELLPRHIYKGNCLLVLDPPYVCTMQGSYRMDGYFGMVEFLRLMRLVRPPFIFFSSTRSELLAYLDFVIETRAEGWERFAGYERIAVNVQVNRNAKYEDNLIYKLG